MLETHGTGQRYYTVVMQDPHGMVKATLPEPKSGGTKHSPTGTYLRPVLSSSQPSRPATMTSQGSAVNDEFTKDEMGT